MKERYLIPAVFFLVISQFQLFSSGRIEEGGESPDALRAGIEQYKQENLAEAAEYFFKAAGSEDSAISAAGYYNHGTSAAQLASKTEDVAAKRELLEAAGESLKRAVELRRLPEIQQKQARRNLEIVRQQLASLPKEQGGDQDEQPDKPQESQGGPADQDGGNSPGGGQAGSDGEAGRQMQNPGELLEKQQQLTEETRSGAGSAEELARQQTQLQQSSEATAAENPEAAEALREAAAQQQRAAEALERGERAEAAEYQMKAEEALVEAENAEAGAQEAENILNREAEYEAQHNRLDKTGGITDAKRNW